MNAQNAEIVGKFVGNYVFSDVTSDHGSKQRKYLRIRAHIDINKPLKTDFFLPKEQNVVLGFNSSMKNLMIFATPVAGCAMDTKIAIAQRIQRVP